MKSVIGSVGGIIAAATDPVLLDATIDPGRTARAALGEETTNESVTEIKTVQTTATGPAGQTKPIARLKIVGANLTEGITSEAAIETSLLELSRMSCVPRINASTARIQDT